jgi:hypothetical protein
VVVGGVSWWLDATGGIGRWHVPCMRQLRRWPAPFPARTVDIFFLLGFCIFLSFHSVSLQ